MIKWTGQPTSRVYTWEKEADNFYQLYNMLVDRNVISTSDYDPYDRAILEKYGKTEDDFNDEDDYFDYDKYCEWCSEIAASLTDKEMWELIADEQGNAYYQTFEIEVDGEYRTITDDDFDAEGNFKY